MGALGADVLFMHGRWKRCLAGGIRAHFLINSLTARQGERNRKSIQCAAVKRAAFENFPLPLPSATRCIVFRQRLKENRNGKAFFPPRTLCLCVRASLCLLVFLPPPPPFLRLCRATLRFSIRRRRHFHGDLPPRIGKQRGKVEEAKREKFSWKRRMLSPSRHKARSLWRRQTDTVAAAS